MNTTEISAAMARAVEYLRDHPDEAKYTDSAATAVLEGSLRVTVTGPDGASSRPICRNRLADEVSRLRLDGFSARPRRVVWLA